MLKSTKRLHNYNTEGIINTMAPSSPPRFAATPNVVMHNTDLGELLSDAYTKDGVKHIWELLASKGSLAFPTIPGRGLFCAALTDQPGADYTGYSNVWVRDNIHIAHAHFATGQPQKAVAVAADIAKFWAAHRHRFVDCISGRADTNDVMQRPHIRFNGHRLKENTETWSHAQNDAVGYFLWLACLLGRAGHIDCSEPALADLLALIPLYLHAVGFWVDKDNGHWEEARKVEASSVGAATAGLRELRCLLDESPSTARAFQAAYTSALSHARALTSADVALADDGSVLVAALETRGHQTLSALLPWESRDDGVERRTDGALLFLVYPLRVVEGDMARQIVEDVVNMLAGDHGIRRYVGDSYWMADYKTLFSEENRTADFSDNMGARDCMLRPGQEAQWCIFDPIISAICGMWALEATNQEREELVRLQTLFFNRSVGQVTGSECAFGAFKCPESYYIEKGRYVVNDICPLLWTQANLLLALHFMHRVAGEVHVGAGNATPA